MRTLMATAVVTVLGLAACKKEHPAPDVYSPVPTFSLLDHHGQPLTRDALVGKVTIADFIFTRCATVCPVITLRMRHLQENTDPRVQLLSFSVDPTYDTPERLAAYAARVKADPARWRFVTGDAGEMQALVEGGIKLPMEPAPPGVSQDAGAPQVLHSDYFVLIDGDGLIRGYYESSDAARVKALLADVETLLR